MQITLTNRVFAITLSMLFLLTGNHTFAMPYAIRNGDTLRIGNNRMERCMLWNNGNPITIQITDKREGLSLYGTNKEPDFTLIRGEAQDGKLEVTLEPSDGVRREYLNACISFRIGTLKVERHYRVYEDCPAMACDTWISGTTDLKEWEMPATIDQIRLTGRHWQTRTVELTDCSDLHDNLVTEHNFVPMNSQNCRGNLLFARHLDSGMGFFFLKECPCPDAQLHYPGADYTVAAGHFMVKGAGISPTDIKQEQPTRAYTVVTGVYAHGEKEALMALHAYQDESRMLVADNDNMIMMNTWGERGEGKNISEQFCLDELDRAAELGINVFQIDAGWNDNYKDWNVSPTKFPQGLHPVINRAKELDIRLALWFSPQNKVDFVNWQKDASILTSLYDEYGIRIFKIDGYDIPNKKAEENFYAFIEHIAKHTGRTAILNMDETAGQRVGFFATAGYGNIFMENRYTDWGNYYPFHTLRNLWMLSRYVSARRLQVEFLNPHRHPEQYAADDPFAPSRYGLDYLFALTMAGQPLAWLEAHNLSEEDMKVSRTIKAYSAIMSEFHRGTVLPIGDEPNGRSWTGFQSILNDQKGFLIVYREDNDMASQVISTFLPRNARIKLKVITGDGRDTTVRTDARGNLPVSLPHPNAFALYRYSVE